MFAVRIVFLPRKTLSLDGETLPQDEQRNCAVSHQSLDHITNLTPTDQTRSLSKEPEAIRNPTRRTHHRRKQRRRERRRPRRRHPDLFMPQRHQRRCSQQRQRRLLQVHRRSQGLYESRHRVRWLHAACPDNLQQDHEGHG